MKNIFDKGHRRSIRIKGYDYSQEGYYFITICVQNRENLFGKILNNEMHLNEAGNMVKKWWLKLENKFPNFVLDEFIVMPNHFHGIVLINYKAGGQTHLSNDIDEGAHAGAPLRTMVQWFKTMTTNEYIQKVKLGKFSSFEKRIWQRNYYEHIIRNDISLKRIKYYIKNNPRNWILDELFKK